MPIPNPPPQRRADSADEPARVWREDRAAVHLEPAARTPQGYLRTHAAVAVPGVLEYEALDGTVTRELIDAEELHKTDSLETLASVPVTVGHPEVDVTPENVGELAVGDVGEEVEILQESGHVRVTLVIRRRDGLDAAEKKDGTNPELSCGYTTVIDPTPGVHPIFGAFDARQTKRRYNHLAIVDEARGGHSLQMRVDGAKRQVSRLDAISTPESTPSKPPAGGFMHPLFLTLSALLSLPYTQRKDGKVFRTDAEEGAEEEATESAMTAAIVDAIRGLQDAMAQAGKAGDTKDANAEALKEELAAAKAKVAELEGALQVMQAEKADMEAAEQAKADKAERERLDALAKKLDFDTASWRDDTKNADRKLDLVRHKGIVKKDETPEPARVDGMIDIMISQALPKTTDDGGDRKDGVWSGIERQVDGKPPKDETRADDKTPDDPFKAKIAKVRADAKA